MGVVRRLEVGMVVHDGTEQQQTGRRVVRRGRIGLEKKVEPYGLG